VVCDPIIEMINRTVNQQEKNYRHHILRPDWLRTPSCEQRGYIQADVLKELWFHTGTICNLSCPFCLEGSKPGDDRLNQITLKDVKPYVLEALKLGVEKFSFTGGEPFVVKDIINILDYTLDHRPCLVLTNGTIPLQRNIDKIRQLKNKPYPLNFRVSIDYPNAKKHDASRGQGNFNLAWQSMEQLHKCGFSISIARQKEGGENSDKIDNQYKKYFIMHGLPLTTRIIGFPDFLTPGSIPEVPHITENCMTQYNTKESRDQFMCHFSKMIVKKNGQMRVFACTLVDDDQDYDLGDSLKESMNIRVMLKHHRCYSCFASGASCSES